MMHTKHEPKPINSGTPRKGHGPRRGPDLRTLLLAYKRAMGLSTATQIDKIRNSIDWRAAAFWLERNVPSYAPQNKETSASMGLLSEDKQGILMTPEACKELSDAYDKRKQHNG